MILRWKDTRLILLLLRQLRCDPRVLGRSKVMLVVLLMCRRRQIKRKVGIEKRQRASGS